jgi:prevent-host-death family protein
MAWQLQDAKQQFGRVVDAARETGPQIVTRHGREVAVLLSIEEYRRLRGTDQSDPLLAGPRDDDFAKILNDIVDERRADTAREVPLRNTCSTRTSSPSFASGHQTQTSPAGSPKSQPATVTSASWSSARSDAASSVSAPGTPHKHRLRDPIAFCPWVRRTFATLSHMTTIPLRELRNNASQVVRRVEAGERLTVTVDGRPAADLIPHSGRRRFASRDDLIRFFSSRTPTPTLRDDVRRLVPDTTDDV